MSKLKLITLLLISFFSIQSFAQNQTVLGKHFNRVITVIFENTNYVDATKQPFFTELSQRGAHFSNLYAITHPSQPNYIALTSGSLHEIKNSAPVDLDVPNITDLLEAKNLTWKAYVEDFPGNCFTGASSGLYERRHNPFISYVNIQKKPARCANIVNADQFETDAANGLLPHYAFYIPHNENSSHNTGIAFADKWYNAKFSKFINDPSFMKDTILMTTFDESNSLASNQIYTSIVGGMINPGDYKDSLSLYSLLKLIEENWDLGDFGKEDITASPIPYIWK